MQLDRPHLELLAAMLADGRLTAAAERIALSPSAASRRLREAERRVGATLTEADGRTLRLTASGRVLADAAVRAQRLVDEAELSARWLDRGTEGRLRMGAGFHDRVAARCAAVLDAELLRTSEATMVGDLRDGRLDLVVDALSPPQLASPDSAVPGHRVTVNPLADDRLVAVLPVGNASVDLGPPDRPFPIEGLEGRPYLISGLDPKLGFEFDRLFRPAGRGPTDLVRVESLAGVLELVAAGAGLSLQPARAVNGFDPDRVAVRPLHPPVPIRWAVLASSDAGGSAVADAARALAGRFVEVNPAAASAVSEKGKTPPGRPGFHRA
ncbi:MAG: LysR family transcriptional regulator [Actinomycetota bacterium]